MIEFQKAGAMDTLVKVRVSAAYALSTVGKNDLPVEGLNRLSVSVQNVVIISKVPFRTIWSWL